MSEEQKSQNVQSKKLLDLFENKNYNSVNSTLFLKNQN